MRTQLALTEDQAILARTASAFAVQQSPLRRVRTLRDSRDPLGYSKALWKQIADLGWTSIPFTEGDGGAGYGMAEVVVVTEALGRCLAPEPFVSAVLLGGQALALGGSAAQKSEWLSPLIAGERVLALAFQERDSRYDLRRVTTRAEPTPGGYRLTGAKVQVMGGHGCDAFVVVARSSGAVADANGITLLLVPANAAGLEVVRQHRLDSRNVALLKLENVDVPASGAVGVADRGIDLLDEVVDRATTALCGEMLGAMTEAFERTMGYLKERVQFGVVIGSFQALKHRAAHMFIEIELARSATMAAARAIDARSNDRTALVSCAKARCSEAYAHIANEAIQMHGGIGMTDEHDIGFFIKHARVAATTFGDADYHRDRFARLCGF
jgi:acyl-CoA dehydrogenase